MNNKGLSLVELICAVAILALVGVGLAGFLSVSSKTFARSSNEIDVQQEAQYAAGIIENIIQDSTESPTPIDDGGVTIGFSVKVKNDEYQVYIDRTNSVLKLTYSIAGGTPQTEILATNITDFTYSVDMSTYASKKKMDLNFTFEKGGKHYKATNSATSRNGASFTVAGDGSAYLRTASEIVLEPNQVYDFSDPSVTTVIGATDPTISVSLRTAGTDSATQILGKSLVIGKNETASELTVDISTNAKKADGVTPAGKTSVKVYIRRVTGISVVGELISGEALKAGARYRVTASLTGINLDKKVLLSTDTDYELYHPFNYDFLYQFFDQGAPVTDYSPYVEIYAPVIPAVILSGEKATLEFKLLQDLPTFGAFSVTVGALHPDGSDGGTLYYNKSHTKYVDTRITAIYSVSNHLYSYNAGSIERFTEQPQSQFTYRQNLLDYYQNKTGLEYMSGMIWRYRPVLGYNDETGERICGPWSEWMDNRGDADDSYAINLRKEATSLFEPSMRYEMQIKLIVKEKVSKTVVWPEEDTPVDQYLIDDTIDPVSLYMKCIGSDSTTFFTREVKYGSEAAPMVFNNNTDYYLGWSDASLGRQHVGIDVNANIVNGLKYVVQKKTDSGWETKFTRVSGGGNLLIQCRVGGSDTEQSDKYVLKESGTYRILLEGNNIKTYIYDATKAAVNDRYIYQERDIRFWDEVTGQGVYYFKVN